MDQQTLRSTIRQLFARSPSAAQLLTELDRLLLHVGERLDARSLALVLRSLQTLQVTLQPRSWRTLRCRGFDAERLRSSLRRLATLLRRLPEPMAASDVGHGLFGCIDLDPSAVPTELLGELAAHVRCSTIPADAAAIATGLLGLQHLDPTVVPRALLEAHVALIERTRRPLTPAEISDALYGLKGLDATVVPRALLETLTRHATAHRARFTAWELARCLYGLQGLDATVVPRALLEALARHAEQCHPALGHVETSNGFYGLQSLDHATVPTRLIDALHAQQRRSAAQMTVQGQATSLYGLLGLRETPAAARATDWLLGLRPSTPLEPIGVTICVQAFALHGTPLPDWLRVAYADARHTCPRVTTPAEFQLARTLRDAGHHCRLSEQVMGFELDLLLPKQQLDIELDGPFHALATRRLRDRRRDAFITARGIRVLRVDVTQPWTHGAILEQVHATTA